MGSLIFTAPRPLEPADSLEGFSCGVSLVDTWLHTRARNARTAGAAVVYVSYDMHGHLAGFYTLSAVRQKGGWPAMPPSKYLGFS